MPKRRGSIQASKPQVIGSNQNALGCFLNLLDCMSKVDMRCKSCPTPEPRCPRRKKITTRMIMPQSEIASSIGGPLTIDQIEISTMTIPSLRLNNFSGNFTYASCKAKDVELEITYSIGSTFGGEIELPLCLGWWPVSGGVDFPVITETFQFGDIDFKGGSFSMSSPTMNISPFSMSPDPFRRTTIDEVTTDAINMKCTSVPLENPLGIRLGVCLPVQNLMSPNDAITEETNIVKMESREISTPQVVMKNINALNITIPSVTTLGFDAASTTNMTITTTKDINSDTATLHGDADSADIWVNLTMTVSRIKMRVKGGLEFKDLKGEVKTDSAISKKFDMNLIMKGIKIKGLNLCGMKIPKIEVDI